MCFCIHPCFLPFIPTYNLSSTCQLWKLNSWNGQEVALDKTKKSKETVLGVGSVKAKTNYWFLPISTRLGRADQFGIEHWWDLVMSEWCETEMKEVFNGDELFVSNYIYTCYCSTDFHSNIKLVLGSYILCFSLISLSLANKNTMPIRSGI